MMKRVFSLALVGLLSLTMSCTTVQKYAAGGAVVGGTIGGIWGANGGGLLNAGEGAGIGAAAGGLAGALLGDQIAQNEYKAELDAKDQQIAALQTENGQLKTQLQACQADLEAANRRISDLEGTIAQLQDELAKCKGARVEMTLLADLLFEPGSARLSSKGKEALNEAAAKLKETGDDEFIMIEGHTDTQPIKYSANLWKDNWDLGSGRAMSVLRYLVSQGVPEAKLAAATYSQYHPVGEDMSQNRRAVIVVHTGWPKN